jgi:hypothetical protein
MPYDVFPRKMPKAARQNSTQHDSASFARELAFY